MTYSKGGPRRRCQAKELDEVLAGGVRPGPARHRARAASPTLRDRQEYTVLVTYADGTSQTFRTPRGLQQPAVFEDLLGMLA